MSVTDEEYENLRKDRDRWKANHDHQVEVNRLLRDRPDLPIERLRSYEDIMRKIRHIKTDAGDMRFSAVKLTESLQNLLGFFDNPIVRLKLPPDEMMKEAIVTARETLAAYSVEE